MSNYKLGLFVIIACLIGVLAYTGFRYKNTIDSKKIGDTKAENTKVDSTQILQEIVNSGLKCDIEQSDGTVTTDNCSLSLVIGDYAKGIMPQGYWIAVRTDNSWNIVVSGNGIPTCSEIDHHSIPKEIYGNCIQPSGQLRF